MKIRSIKDFYSGVIFIFFGIATVYIAREYPMGTALRMGPGYFPTVLGYLLVVLGLILAIRSFRITGSSISRWAARPVVLVLVSVVVFGWSVQALGLVLSTVLLVLISALGSNAFRWRDAILLSALLTTLAVTVFFYGLHVSLTLWPMWIY